MSSAQEKPIISVIMPAYNEEERLEECFERVYEALKRYGKPFEIILEEDGSSDMTPQIIDKLAKSHSNVKALHFPRRMGKGFGVRRCFEEARGEFIVLIDSDLEYPPEKIPDMLDAIDGNDIIVGSRKIWINRNNGNIKLIRAYLSRIYGFFIKHMFGVRFEDLQTGFKAFRRNVIEAIQPLTSNGFEIDSEILIKAARRGFRIGYIPVTYNYKGNSKVSIYRDPVKMFFSLLKWKLNGKVLALH
ncbi:MAG: glycosyltransferase family 2 protein [Nitrososphaerota archaeon]|nr:glycosyltransferase family 2 protein [Candidatus Bathyarchaeota archaeon]MDW8048710.1 glycosyltransferase family 2 protein [Nitrososphaerota archaeon]